MKYEHVSNHVIAMYEKIKTQHFPHLTNAKIILLNNKKKMMPRGNIALGKIMKPSDLVKFLSREEAPEDGYDYIMLLDSKLLQHCNDGDIERVLRHELRHTFFDSDSSKNPYKLIDHDFSDFYAEVELNQDAPTWTQRVSQAVASSTTRKKTKSRPSASPSHLLGVCQAVAALWGSVGLAPEPSDGHG